MLCLIPSEIRRPRDIFFPRCRERRKSITIAYSREGKAKCFDRGVAGDRGKCSRDFVALVPRVFIEFSLILHLSVCLSYFSFFSFLPLCRLSSSARPGTRQCGPFGGVELRLVFPFGGPGESKVERKSGVARND